MVAAKWRLFLALEYVMQLHHEPLVAEEIGLPDAIQTAVYVVSLARQCVIDPTESDAELVRTLSDKLRLSATERASGVARGLQRYAAGYSTLLA
jgi:hypothetical protein